MIEFTASLPEDADEQCRRQALAMFVLAPSFTGAFTMIGILALGFHADYWLFAGLPYLLIAVFALRGHRLPAVLAAALANSYLWHAPPLWAAGGWLAALAVLAALFARHHVWLQTAGPMPPERAEPLRSSVSDPTLILSVLLAPLGLLPALAHRKQCAEAWRSWVAYDPPAMPGIARSPAGPRRLRLGLTLFVSGLAFGPVVYAVVVASALAGLVSSTLRLAVGTLGFFALPGLLVMLWCFGTVGFFLPDLEKAHERQPA